MAAGKKGAGIVWKQHPLERYFADAAALSEQFTIAKCPLSQTGNHWDDFLLSFLECQQCWGSRLDHAGRMWKCQQGWFKPKEQNAVPETNS